MRSPVFPFVAMVAAGAALGVHIPIAFGVPATCFVLLALVARRIRFGIWIGAFVVGLAAGVVANNRVHTACRIVWPTGDRAAVLRLHDSPGPGGTADATVLHSTPLCDGTVRIRMAEGVIPAGARFVAVGVVRGGGVLRVDHARQLGAYRPLRFVLRSAVRSRIEALYGARGPLVEAMILGRRHDVDEELRAGFVDSGLAHLLAISGLHVGIFATWVTIVARRFLLGARPWLAGAALSWLYVFLLGFPVPATRAAVFITVAALARQRQRHPPLEVVLAVAVLALIALDARVLFSVGAWLSVAAVWSTVRAGRIVRGADGRVRQFLRLLAGSVGATIGTAPVTALVFGSVAPIGIVANLIAVPAASLAVPAIFMSLVGGSLLAGGAGILVGVLETVARYAATIPGGHWDGVAGVRFAAPWAFLALVSWWWVVRRPPGRVAIRRSVYVLAAGLWLALSFPRLRRMGSAGMLEIHVLDVGQGDAIAVRSPAGRWVLVDAGPRNPRWDAGQRIVLPFLRRRGVSTLEAVIVSHGDADHLGGFPSVLRAIPAHLALEPGMPLGTGLYVDFQGVIDSAGTRWWPARSGDTLVVDSVVFAVVHPTGKWVREGHGPNESSVVVRVTYRDFDALLTGDIGEPAERFLLDSVQPVEVLKVAHHGSRGGTIDEWIGALRPSVAIISAGLGNRYGHPAPEVLGRLARAKVTTFRTDLQGPVTVKSDGRYYDVTIQQRTSIIERLICLLPTSLLSSVSSPIRNECTRTQPGNSRVSFTTSPSQPKSFRGRFAGRD